MNADKWMAFTEERLGNLPEALIYRQEAVAEATALVAADPKNQTSRGFMDESIGAAVRVQRLISGPAGRFPMLPGPDPVTPQRIRSSLARGFLVSSIEFDSTSDPAAQLASALASLDLYREAVAENPTPVLRAYLARVLERVASSYRQTARRGPASARTEAYKQCLRYAVEGRDLFAELKIAGVLPAALGTNLATTADYALIARVRLEELQKVALK